MLIKITNKRGYEGYIQTDFIQTIDVTKDLCRIRMNNDPDTITLTLEEWQRIAPLLIPAPVPALPTVSINQLAFSKLMHAWYNAQQNAYEAIPEPTFADIQAEKDAYFAVVSYIESMQPTPYFPNALITAYREFQRMLSLTGVTEAQLDSQRRHIFSLLDDAMPTEEIDHE